MGKPFRKTTVRYHLPTGERCTADAPGAIRSEVKSRKYYGTVAGRQVPLCADFQKSKQLLAKLETDATMQAHGIGVYDRHHRRPLADHLDDFERFLTAKNDDAKYAALVAGRARRLMSGCGFIYIADIDSSKVQGHVADLRDQGLSAQTCNFYLGAAKQFTRWLVRDRRTGNNPLEHLQGGNVRSDRRHDRRELSPDELTHLLDAARTGPTMRGLTGPDREMLYLTACCTGLRAQELASLTPRNLSLAVQGATVTVEAGYAKNGRSDTLPLPEALAGRLREWVADRPAGLPLWPGRWAIDGKGATMLRADLGRARELWIAEATNASDRKAREGSDFLAYRDLAGRYADLHACRHTFVSNVVRSGATPKVAQTLARHSTPVLTIGRYSHVALHDLDAAVQALPVPSKQKPVAEAERVRKTGTDGESGCTLVAQIPCNQGHSESPAGILNSINEEGAVSPQPLAESLSCIDCHPQSLSTPGRTRTCDRRFRKPLPADRKSLSDQDDTSAAVPRLHGGCTDEALERLNSLWPSLPAHVRQAITLLVEAHEQTK